MNKNLKKIKEWVGIYTKHIEEITPEVHVRDEEGYKFKSVDIFQSNFNIDAPDLALMLEQSIKQNTLVAGSMYFPKGVLLSFAQKYEEETRKVLRILFDEKREISVRINEAEEKFNQILGIWN
ncbi:hypothetical protein KKE99_05500, partial [Patescibacteria group bacterium]|nr:hypothetical protein [Patescibacteria group bacterium]